MNTIQLDITLDTHMQFYDPKAVKYTYAQHECEKIKSTAPNFRSMECIMMEVEGTDSGFLPTLVDDGWAQPLLGNH